MLSCSRTILGCIRNRFNTSLILAQNRLQATPGRLAPRSRDPRPGRARLDGSFPAANTANTANTGFRRVADGVAKALRRTETLD
jgi:hypothetical protein